MGGYSWFEQLKNTEDFIIGDINIDFQINILDVITLADIIAQNVLPSNSQALLGDMNSDSINDILDIILIVNIILSN